ncbi:MAG: serine/threonine-protein kinase [Hyalangium sp.]|uniref:serine/threonine-protein kinase n=1 Tax=Hyalangium sp. TaxID=2028555 RepID=UPI00389AA1E7
MPDALTPDSLRPGDMVGPWRIEGYAGRGTYGVVYRARRASRPGSVPVALKLALFAYDPRFLREAELLSRTHHPAIPELVDRGWWHTDEGRGHPYLVMQWIEGRPLYEWARVHEPTSRQVLQVVAQVAGGLAVLHMSGGLHRDVKGDNILVEPEGRAFLMDFGSGTWAGAPPLTESLMPPGTREYRGPEALRFQWKHLRERGVHYESRTYDDLYALGVSAYRLVTGCYPPPGTDPEAREDPIREPPPPREPPQALNARVIPELAVLIERMLAAGPEARGSAREIAEAAELAAERAGPEADVPLVGRRQPPVAGVEQASPERENAPVRVLTESPGERWRVRARLLVAAVGLVLLMVGICWRGDSPRVQSSQFVQAEELDEGLEEDGGMVGVGDASVTVRVTSEDSSAVPGALTVQVPDEPLPGQMRAPCRRRGTVAIKGGCWIPWLTLTPPCGDGAYEWKGACFWPITERAQPPPTSKKPQ